MTTGFIISTTNTSLIVAIPTTRSMAVAKPLTRNDCGAMESLLETRQRLNGARNHL